MARQFNGTSDHLLMDDLLPTLGAQCTIEFWFRSTSTAQRHFFGAADTGATAASLISTNLNNDTTSTGWMRFFLRRSNGASTIGSANILSAYNGNWHHILWQRDGQTISLWVDGVSQTVNHNHGSGGIGSNTIVMTEYNHALGAWNNRGSIEAFLPGDLYDFRIWNRLLSAQEKADRRAGEEISATDLILHYLLDTAAATEIDLSTSEIDATATGTSLTDSPTPWDHIGQTLTGVWNNNTQAIDLSWVPPTNASAQEVHRSLDSAFGTYDVLTTLSGSADFYSDSTVNQFGPYYYRVRATIGGDDFDSQVVAVGADGRANRRIATAVTYAALVNDTRRVPTAVVYAVTGPNKRRVPTSVVYAVEQESLEPDVSVDLTAVATLTADADVVDTTIKLAHVDLTGVATLFANGHTLLPGFPTIAGIALDPFTIRLFLGAADNTVSHELYRDNVLIASWIGPIPDTYDDENLEFGTYEYFLRAVNTFGFRDSDAIQVTTGDTLSLVGVTDTTASLQYYHIDAATHVQYQTTTDADTDFNNPIEDVTLDTDERFIHIVEGLNPSTAYRARARIFINGAWSIWSNVVTWTTLATPPPPIRDFTLIHPANHGEPISGEVQIIWETDQNVVNVWITTNLDEFCVSSPSTLLEGFTNDGILLDTTLFEDGLYKLYIELEDGTITETHSFRIDNLGEVTYADDFSEEGYTSWTNYWSPNVTRHVFGSSCLLNSTGHWKHNPPASFGPFLPEELSFNAGVSVSATMYPIVTGAGFLWDRTWGGQHLDFGVAVISTGSTLGLHGDAIGIRAGVTHMTLTSALAGHGGWDPDDPHRYVGTGTGKFWVTIGPVFNFDTAASGILFGGWGLAFSMPIPVATSWLHMRVQQIGGSFWDSQCGIRPYHFDLRVIRPDPILFPYHLDVCARVSGYDPHSPTGRFTAEISETVETKWVDLDGIEQSHIFECGHVSFFSRATFGASSDQGARVLRSFSARVLTPSDVCVPLCPEFECGQPSAVVHIESTLLINQNIVILNIMGGLDETYTLEWSSDGENWFLIATGVPAGEFVWDITGLPPGTLFVRAIPESVNEFVSDPEEIISVSDPIHIPVDGGANTCKNFRIHDAERKGRITFVEPEYGTVVRLE